jgi:hypothetical protein
MMYAGFFVSLNSLPGWIAWVQYISPFKYGFEMLVVNEFDGLPINCTYPPGVPGDRFPCPIDSGDQVLRFLGLGYRDIWVSVVALLLQTLMWHTLAYGLLHLWYSKRRGGGPLPPTHRHSRPAGGGGVTGSTSAATPTSATSCTVHRRLCAHVCVSVSAVIYMKQCGDIHPRSRPCLGRFILPIGSVFSVFCRASPQLLPQCAVRRFWRWRWRPACWCWPWSRSCVRSSASSRRARPSSASIFRAASMALAAVRRGLCSYLPNRRHGRSHAAHPRALRGHRDPMQLHGWVGELAV